MSLLEVRNLNKAFGSNRVLRDVSFDVEKGEVVSIIGSSGGGKTTLLRCLNLLEIPDCGTIFVNGDPVFDGTNPGEKAIRMRRLHFGLVFQQFNLFPQYNVYENICLAPKLNAGGDKEMLEHIRTAADELLERVGLTEKKLCYPGELSGGQQQRVAIARALAMNPDILCFDEPTSALDPELTGEVLKVIRELKSGDSTMIIVTHEMEFARAVSDRAIFMAGGEIEESGRPDELFGSPRSEKLRSFLKSFSR